MQRFDVKHSYSTPVALVVKFFLRLFTQLNTNCVPCLCEREANVPRNSVTHFVGKFDEPFLFWTCPSVFCFHFDENFYDVASIVHAEYEIVWQTATNSHLTEMIQQCWVAGLTFASDVREKKD